MADDEQTTMGFERGTWHVPKSTNRPARWWREAEGVLTALVWEGHLPMKRADLVGALNHLAVPRNVAVPGQGCRVAGAFKKDGGRPRLSATLADVDELIRATGNVWNDSAIVTDPA